MKKDFRKVVVSMSSDTQAIPAKISNAVQEFRNAEGFDRISLSKYCGNWDGCQFDSAILHIHKDFVQKFKNQYPSLF